MFKAIFDRFDDVGILEGDLVWRQPGCWGSGDEEIQQYV